MRIISLLSDNIKQIFNEATDRKAPFSLVIYWPWFYKSWIGLTIGFIIFTKKPDDVAHLCHELVHVEQFYKQPLTFWVRYLIERKRVGYWHSQYEKGAYDIQQKVTVFLKSQKQ